MIYIIGTGRLAIELYPWVENFGGFIGDKPIPELEGKAKVVDKLEWWQPDLRDRCLVAEEDIVNRMAIVDYLAKKYIKAAYLVCKGAYMFGEVDMGTIVMPNAVVSATAKIGQNTIIWPNVVIRSGVTIGDFCNIYPGAVISANVGRCSSVGAYSIVNYKVGENNNIPPQTVVNNYLWRKV